MQHVISLLTSHRISLGYHKEEYYLLIHADGVDMLWCALTTSRAQPHELFQEILNYSDIQVRSIRFDNGMEFGQSDHFKSWSKAKGEGKLESRPKLNLVTVGRDSSFPSRLQEETPL